MSDVTGLSQLAEFLERHGIHAFAALLLVAVVVLHRQLRRVEREKFELALMLSPLAEKLTKLLEAGSRRRQRPPNDHGEGP